MKLRIGFVSNSSTSSFLIYGVYLDNLYIIYKGERGESVSDKLYEVAKEILTAKNIKYQKLRNENVYQRDIRERLLSITKYKDNHSFVYSSNKIIEDGKRCDNIPDDIYQYALEFLENYVFKPQTSLDYYDIVEIIGQGIESQFPEEGCYIGKSWDLVRDDQTGLEFKTEIEEILKPYFPDAEFGTLEEAWRDG